MQCCLFDLLGRSSELSILIKIQFSVLNVKLDNKISITLVGLFVQAMDLTITVEFVLDAIQLADPA